MPNDNPILVSDPIFVPLLTGSTSLPANLLNGMTPQQFVAAAVQIINQSTTLVEEINNLSANKWTIAYGAVTETNYNSQASQIIVNSASILASVATAPAQGSVFQNGLYDISGGQPITGTQKFPHTIHWRADVCRCSCT